MISKYYQEELDNLRISAAEFGRAHPALAPMLDAKGSDPDVERLLEGVAFMSSMARQRLDEGFPRMVEALMEILLPQLLRPVPAMTLMAFSPAQGFNETATVRRGAKLASVPVDGVRALFSLVSPLQILPATVVSAKSEDRSGGEAAITVQISATAPVGQWCPPQLVLHFGGPYAKASAIRKLILRKTISVVATAGDKVARLGPEAVSAASIERFETGAENERFLAGYELIREYFAMPQRFMFARIGGLEAFSSSSALSMSLVFNLAGLKEPVGALGDDRVMLNVAPAANLFSHPANPILVDHKRDEYKLTPQKAEAERLAIHSVRKVVSSRRDGTERVYKPFDYFSRCVDGGGAYFLRREASARGGRPRFALGLVYDSNGRTPVEETLSVELDCYNHTVTDLLRKGDVRDPTDSSPAMAVFSNIIAPVASFPALEGEERLWRMLSHLHVNLMPLASAEALRDILSVYLGPGDRDAGRKIANEAKVLALKRLTARPEDRFIRGLPIRGTSIELQVDGAAFASSGDLCLFGDVLEIFLCSLVSLNTFSRLTIIDSSTHEVLRWPARLGSKRIL